MQFNGPINSLVNSSHPHDSRAARTSLYMHPVQINSKSRILGDVDQNRKFLAMAHLWPIYRIPRDLYVSNLGSAERITWKEG